MDKMPFSAPVYARRKGFALILALSVLAVVITLTGVLVGYLDRAREDASATKALIQGNVYFSDIKKMLKGFNGRQALYHTLYLAPVSLTSQNGDFSLVMQCMPMDRGVNINWLAYANVSLMDPQYNAVRKVFDTLVEMYGLDDPIRLEEMLLARIGKVGSPEGTAQNRIPVTKGILSYRQFQEVLEAYRFETDDAKVGKIPWRDYFTFLPVSSSPKENLIEGDYLDPPILSILFDMEESLIEEEWVKAQGALKRFLSSQGIVPDKKFYGQRFLDRSECSVTYTYEGAQYMFTFVDNKKEVKYFEFYGKQ